MTEYSRIEVERTSAVVWLRLARPEAGNRVDARMIEELGRALTDLSDDASASFVVVRGSGGTFCSGMEHPGADRDGGHDVQVFSRWERALGTLERLPQVTIAVMEGECTGAGLDLALACDFRLASTDGRVRLPETKDGTLPMALFRLPKYVGLGVAKRMVMTGSAWSADEALAVGLLDAVVPADELGSRLERLIEEYSPVNATAVAMARRLLHESYATAGEDAIGNFLAAQHRCLWRRTALAT
jgi:enoyl-CoA hydratase/carnithine racemase